MLYDDVDIGGAGGEDEIQKETNGVVEFWAAIGRLMVAFMVFAVLAFWIMILLRILLFVTDLLF